MSRGSVHISGVGIEEFYSSLSCIKDSPVPRLLFCMWNYSGNETT